MVEAYRVEAVEAATPETRAEFLRLPRVYVLVRLRDGRVRRLRAPLQPGWRVGAQVELPETRFLGGAG